MQAEWSNRTQGYANFLQLLKTKRTLGIALNEGQENLSRMILKRDRPQ
jgi:hypothetical protein